MCLRSVQIKNIRSIRDLHWSIGSAKAAGWHVVIGDNGAGKSSFLRSIALALVGPKEAFALRQNWSDWLSRGRPSGFVRLGIDYDYALDKFSGSGNTPYGTIIVRVNFSREHNDVNLKATTQRNANRTVWGNKSGWFSASYGPFRRFAGGDNAVERIFVTNPKLASHLSVFGENVALTESLKWLTELNYKKLEKDHQGDLLDLLKNFINQDGFLPHKARLAEVSSKGVEFVDGNESELLVEDLSDGYRSILSMTFELIRQLSRVYAPSYIFNEDATKIVAPGVVLIDEVDAHLHPTWQRRIGVWLREHFPKMQFIVTTHSPLICQAADVGTVWVLPRPGTDEIGRRLSGVELDRLLYGNVLDAYSTEAFGENISRSDEAKKKLQLLAELNRKELHGQLTSSELKEQEDLRAALPTSAHTLAGDASE